MFVLRVYFLARTRSAGRIDGFNVALFSLGVDCGSILLANDGKHDLSRGFDGRDSCLDVLAPIQSSQVGKIYAAGSLLTRPASIFVVICVVALFFFTLAMNSDGGVKPLAIAQTSQSDISV